MDEYIPRKYKNTIIIILIVIVVIAIGIIIYQYINDKPTMQVQQRPPQQRQIPPTPAMAAEETRIIGTGKPALVFFWASSCPHCTNMKPAWDKASAILNESGTIEALDFEMSKDADIIKEAQGKLKIEGFPDIRFFPEGFDLNKKSVHYQGNRSEEDLLKFAYQNKK
jgi:thiol-disulfide isomerase/thioredoxin